MRYEFLSGTVQYSLLPLCVLKCLCFAKFSYIALLSFMWITIYIWYLDFVPEKVKAEDALSERKLAETGEG